MYFAPVLLSLVLIVNARPLTRRQVVVDPPPEDGSSNVNASSAAVDTSGGNNLVVVKFAALAESLEATFYEQALSKFSASDMTNAGFADGEAIFAQLATIRDDEKTHLQVLQSVAQSLGGSTSDVDSCQFNFDAALTDITTFAATARVLEIVGVSAYIGGATLIEDKSLLVSALEITTVEARHNTILNIFNGGQSVPSPFDVVLSPQQVLSIAAPFISGGCDPVAALGLTPTPALAVTNTDTPVSGTTLTFGGAGLDNQDQSQLFCQLIVGGSTEAIVFPVPQCVVPDGLDGPVQLFITNSDTKLQSNIVNQDSSTIVAGPAVAFIDSTPNSLTNLLKGQGGDNGSDTLSDSGSQRIKQIITQTTVIETETIE